MSSSPPISPHNIEKSVSDTENQLEETKDTSKSAQNESAEQDLPKRSSHVVCIVEPKPQQGYDFYASRQEAKNPIMGRILTCLSILLLVITFPIGIFFVLTVIKQYERAVIFRLGRLRPGGAKGPGLFYILPCVDTYVKVDLRTVSFDVPKQEVLTRDSVTVEVDAAIYYRVLDPLCAVVKVANYRRSTKLLAATTLRNVLGTKDMAMLLSDREAITQQIWQLLDDATGPWGVYVERVEIKDVRLPKELQRAMAAEAEAHREARAKIIEAQGEISAARALQEASKKMINNPVALQLRYLQALNTMASAETSTVIFPFPTEIIKTFFAR